MSPMSLEFHAQTLNMTPVTPIAGGSAQHARASKRIARTKTTKVILAHL